MNKCADDLADDLIRSLYRTAFEPNYEDPLADTAGTPFIASFCSHRHDEYERENGLLSQWRGYGGKSGFCIVLDTARLGAMLGGEFDTYAFTHLNLSPAHYADADTTVASAFPGVLTACEEIVERILSGQRGDSDALDQFFAAATLIKHRAFREEREVRIAAIPITPRMRAMIEQENVGVEVRPSRPELGGGPSGAKRYIELFKDSGEVLPIKRVIVGPSPDQAKGIAFAEQVSGGRFPVAASVTPFKG